MPPKRYSPKLVNSETVFDAAVYESGPDTPNNDVAIIN